MNSLLLMNVDYMDPEIKDTPGKYVQPFITLNSFEEIIWLLKYTKA